MSFEARLFEMPLTQDEFMRAMEFLEENLEEKIFRFDVDEVKGMCEQVVGEKR